MVENKFDELLTQLGTGKWNVVFFFITGYWNMHLAPQTLGGAFLAPKVDYTCHTPEEGYQVISTVVSDIDGSIINTTDHCEYIAKSKDNGGFEKQPCENWNYDNTTFKNTLTSEYDLVCSSEYLRATYQSMYMFGSFFGAPINGFLADRFGRKTMLCIGVIVYSIVAIGSCWIPDFSALLASRFVLGLMHPVGLHTGYILALEVCEPRYRAILGILIALPWAFGTMAWGGLAYLLREWRWLQLSVSLSAVLVIPVLWFIDESPRWLIVNGHFERANKVLQRAARWNNVTLPPQEELNQMMRSIQKESAGGKQQTLQDQQEVSGCHQKTLNYIKRLFILFRTPKLRMITLIMYLKFFMVSMVFYGLSLNAVNYSANPFVYMVLSGLVEVPAYTITAPIVAIVGRRLPSIVLYFLSGTAIFAVAFISPSISWLVMTLAMVGKMCISAAFQLLYLYGTELFPTEVRLHAIGSATIASRIGSIISPFITELLGPLYPRAPSILFGLGAIVTGIATIPLHETLGRPLPDTITDLESPSHRNTEPEEPNEETEMAKLRA